MALVKCPECGKSVSDNAEVCPNCGIEKVTSNAEEDDKRSEERRPLALLIFPWASLLGARLLVEQRASSFMIGEHTNVSLDSAELFASMTVGAGWLTTMAAILLLVSRRERAAWYSKVALVLSVVAIIELGLITVMSIFGSETTVVMLLHAVAPLLTLFGSIIGIVKFGSRK